MTDYILFVFAEHPNQDEFVKNIAEDISVVSESLNIKYYYGPSSAMITFKSEDSIKELNEFLSIIFFSDKIVYLLLPYSPDNMSVGMSPETFKHLFNRDLSETMSGIETTAQNVNEEEIHEKFKFVMRERYEDEDDEDEEIESLKNKTQPLNVDDILDNISSNGIESLTPSEKKFLETYSKNC